MTDQTEKSDQYGEWVLHQNGELSDSGPQLIDRELLAAARSAWPRVLAHVRRELSQQDSGAGAQAVAAEVWESVLRSVSRALQRKADRGSSISDLQAYLFSAFHHRFNRILRAEQKRHETTAIVSSAVEFDRIEAAQDTLWAPKLERAIIVKQVVGHMDEWTKKVWQARQYGYSWKEISRRWGMNESAAKMKFHYGLEKTRQSLFKAMRQKKAG